MILIADLSSSSCGGGQNEETARSPKERKRERESYAKGGREGGRGKMWRGAVKRSRIKRPWKKMNAKYKKDTVEQAAAAAIGKCQGEFQSVKSCGIRRKWQREIQTRALSAAHRLSVYVRVYIYIYACTRG